MPGRILSTVTNHFVGMLLADDNILREDAVQRLEKHFTKLGVDPVPLHMMNDAFDLALQVVIGVPHA